LPAFQFQNLHGIISKSFFGFYTHSKGLINNPPCE
jgi:hypothetical protein